MEDRVNGLDERLSVMDARLVVTQEQIALRTTEKTDGPQIESRRGKAWDLGQEDGLP